MRRSIVVSGAALSAAIALMLAGCSPSPLSHSTPSRAAASSAPAADPVPSATPSVDPAAARIAGQYEYVFPAGTVLATGTLTGQTDDAQGSVTVVVDSALEIEVRLTGFHTAGPAELRAGLSTDRFGARAGTPVVPVADQALGLTTGASGDQIFILDREGRRDRGDVSYFNSFELADFDGNVSAYAALTWTTPDPYPGLIVTDHGVRPYARGTVTTYEGAPAIYTPNPLDTLVAVCARFGLTPDELAYLNPELDHTTPTILRDQPLDLSPAYRTDR